MVRAGDAAPRSFIDRKARQTAILDFFGGLALRGIADVRIDIGSRRCTAVTANVADAVGQREEIAGQRGRRSAFVARCSQRWRILALPPDTVSRQIKTAGIDPRSAVLFTSSPAASRAARIDHGIV
jgi:hypothetical protein